MNSKSWLVTMVDEHGNEGCGSFKNIEIDGRYNEAKANCIAKFLTSKEGMAGFIIKKGGSWGDLHGMAPRYLKTFYSEKEDPR